MNFPAKKYQIIYADPPWSYRNKGTRAAAEKHYSTMSIEDIKALPVADIAADNCVLFLWTTFPMLREALETIEAWGFEYKTLAFCWAKRNKSGKGWFWGLGNWTRSNPEICLLAIKGHPQRVSAAVHSLLDCPVVNTLPSLRRPESALWSSWGTSHELNCLPGRECLGGIAGGMRYD